MINCTVLHAGAGGKWASPALVGTDFHFDWAGGNIQRQHRASKAQEREQGMVREPSGWKTSQGV